MTKEMLFKTARLRPDIDKIWTPKGFEPGEIVSVRYWKHEYDATTRVHRPIYVIAKSSDFDRQLADGRFSTVFNSALDSFVL